MAGIQQAVNAITGAIGTVGGRAGVYNELVGKNQKQTQIGKKLLTAVQEKAAMRYRANQNSHESKRAMLNILYQQPTEETPFFKKEDKGGK